jgi:EF-P beta-lysylation protein EpmB
MIPRIASPEKTADWQRLLRQAITSPAELFRQLKLDPSSLPAVLQAAGEFSVMVPPGYLAKMEPGNSDDPLLLQVLPQAAEVAAQPPGYQHDPVGDDAASPHAGLIHKYHGRVLLITTGACAVHCRYCFRRHYPYAKGSASLQQLQPALDWIRQHDDIEEVILSGGDPLMLSDSRLNQLISTIETIPHVQRLRFHSRLPVVLPERITTELLDRLQQSRLEILMVIHANHPAELDDSVAHACGLMRAADVLLLNQSVLLNGINNRPDVLEKLYKRLFSLGVQPYYLHLLDKVHGAAHFDVDETSARRLYADVSARLPGYMTPRLTREIGGERSKRLLGFD